MNQREPTLDELLNEPIIRQVMLSDGVRADDIRELLRTAGDRDASHGADDSFPAPAYPARFHTFGCGASAC
jgi:hypothetical protein